MTISRVYKPGINEESRKIGFEQMIFDLFLNDTSAAIITLDPTGDILAVNPYVEKIFGYTSEELLGKSIDVIIPVNALTPDRNSMFSYWQAPTSTIVGSREQLVGKRKNGSRFQISAYLAPLLSPKGLQVLCIVRNRERSRPKLSDSAIIMLDALEKERRQIATSVQKDLIREMVMINDQLMNRGQKFVQAERLLAMLDQGRAISHDIYPLELHSKGLDKEISAHSQKIAKANRNLSIRLDMMPDGGRLDDRTRLVLYRAYQQVIGNVLQHACASSVEILFTFNRERIILEIDDDGLGFEMPESWQTLAANNQYGLIKTIAEVNALEGRITIDTRPGGGTAIRLVLPNRSYRPEPFQG